MAESKQQQPRLRAGAKNTNPGGWADVEIGSSWEYVEEENAASARLSVRLPSPDMAAAFGSPDQRFEFAIGRQTSPGVWADVTVLMAGGEFESIAHTVAQGAFGPTDVATLTIKAAQNAKFNKTAELDLVIFDPTRTDYDETQVEPVYDEAGNPYFPEVLEVRGLTLHRLFQEIFVERCEFEDFQTNIPDYPIQRLDCAMGASLYESLLGYIGMWEPLVYTEGDTVWIVDTTMRSPGDNAPSGRPFTPKTYFSLNGQDASDRLNALAVTYIEMARAFDYYTIANDPEEVTNVRENEVVIITQKTNRQHREYRRRILPFVVQRRVLNKETKETYDGSTLIERVEDTLQYDYAGRLVEREKIEETLLPSSYNAEAETYSLALMRTAEETEEYVYRQHPFKQRQIYLAEKKFLRKGLVAYDHANPRLGEPYAASYKQAYRNGNVTREQMESLSVAQQNIEARIEKALPLRSGEVRVDVTEVDYLNKVLSRAYTEERAGDIGMNALVPSTQRILVFNTAAGAERTTERIDQLHGGEVPLGLLIPLAKRVLKQRQDANGRLSMDGVGYERGVLRGTMLSPYRRQLNGAGAYQFIANYLVTALAVRGAGPVITATYTGKKV